MNKEEYIAYLKKAQSFLLQLQSRFIEWSDEQKQSALDIIVGQITTQIKRSESFFVTDTTFKHDVVTYLWNLLHDLEKRRTKSWTQNSPLYALDAPPRFSDLFTRFLKVIGSEITHLEQLDVPIHNQRIDKNLISWSGNDDELHRYVELIEKFLNTSLTNSEHHELAIIRDKYYTPNAPSSDDTFSSSWTNRAATLRIVSENLDYLKTLAVKAPYIIDMACGISNALPYSVKRRMFPKNVYIGVDFNIQNIALRYLATKYPSKTISEIFTSIFWGIPIKHAFNPDFSKLDVYVQGNVFSPRLSNGSAFLIFFDRTMFSDNNLRHLTDGYQSIKTVIWNLLIDGGVCIFTNHFQSSLAIKKGDGLETVQMYENSSESVERKANEAVAKNIFPSLDHAHAF